MRKGPFGLLLALSVLLTVFQGVPHATASTGPLVLFGATPTLQPPNQPLALDGFQGKHSSVQDAFLNFNVTDPSQDAATLSTSPSAPGTLLQFWNDGYVPMLTWLAPLDSSAFSAGTYDSYLDGFAAQLKAFLAGPDGVLGNGDDRRMYIRPSHEANLSGCSYCPVGAATLYGNNPVYRTNAANYKAGWAHLYSLFRGQGLDAQHLQFIFSVNNVDAYIRTTPTNPAPEPIMEDIYPGNAVVDWIAVDGYQNTFSDTPDSVFGPMLSRLQAVSNNERPIGITEWGSKPIDQSGTVGTPAGIQVKNNYISAFFAWLSSQPLRMAVYWNSTDSAGTTDYEVLGIGTYGDSTYSYDGSMYSGFSSYATSVATASDLLSSDPTNSRLITDAAFTGTG